MHSCFFSGKEKEPVTLSTKNCRTHIVPFVGKRAQHILEVERGEKKCCFISCLINF
jgi:hypothetical protein